MNNANGFFSLFSHDAEDPDPHAEAFQDFLSHAIAAALTQAAASNEPPVDDGTDDLEMPPLEPIGTVHQHPANAGDNTHDDDLAMPALEPVPTSNTTSDTADATEDARDDTSMPDLEPITENRHEGAPTTSGNVVIYFTAR